MSTSPPETTQAPVEKRRRGGPLAKENRRLVYGLILGAIVAGFAVANLDDVQVNWLLGTWSTPLIVAIAISFLLGSGVGFLLARRRPRMRKPRRARR